MAKRLTDDERSRAARIVALLMSLVHARLTDDYETAASAKASLADLGVELRFRRRPEQEVRQ